MHTYLYVYGAGGGDCQAFLLEVAILLADLNYVYCAIIFFIYFFFFYSVKPSFSVFILPCNNLSFLYVTVSSLVHIMYAIWSKDSFQIFLLGMVVSLIGLKPHWWTLVFFAIWNLDLRYICVLKWYDICELRNANNAILSCCIWNSILSNYLFVYLNLAPLA